MTPLAGQKSAPYVALGGPAGAAFAGFSQAKS
jgi:hypothetical protein